MKTINTLHISARRWFQRTYGNTYHSVKVYVNGEVLSCPYEYGYGDQFLQTAERLLTQAGYDLKTPPGREKYFSLGTRHLREVLGGTYEVVDVTRKKDL